MSSSSPPHLRAGCPRLLRPGGRRGAPGVGAPLRSVPCPWLLWPWYSLIHVFLRHPSGRTTSPCPPAALTRLEMNSNLTARAETSLRFLPGLGGPGRARRARRPHGHCAAPRRIGCAPPVRLWKGIGRRQQGVSLKWQCCWVTAAAFCRQVTSAADDRRIRSACMPDAFFIRVFRPES